MKRFMVFGGVEFYPSGGWNDFLESFENLDAAKAFAEKSCNVGETRLASSDICTVTCRIHKVPAVCRSYDMSWVQIVDFQTGTIIELSVEGDYCPVCHQIPDFPRWSEAA